MSEDYQVYLRSKHWRGVRFVFWQENDPICCVCGTRDDAELLDIHHRSYEHIGCEQWDELVALCHSCHTTVHRLVDNEQTTLWDAHLFLGAQPNDDTRVAERISLPSLRTERHERAFAPADVPIFSPHQRYTPKQLDRMATYWLWSRRDAPRSIPMLLTQDQWRERQKRELFTKGAAPDPAHTQDIYGNYIDGMYWRTHPFGRPFCPDPKQRRLHGMSFYARSGKIDASYRMPPLPKTVLQDPIPRWRIVREMLRHYAEWRDLVAQDGRLHMIEYGYRVRDESGEVRYEYVVVSFWDLLQKIKDLAPQQRNAVFYNVLFDRKQREVAKIMGITTVTVGQYVEAAMKTLAASIFCEEVPGQKTKRPKPPPGKRQESAKKSAQKLRRPRHKKNGRSVVVGRAADGRAIIEKRI